MGARKPVDVFLCLCHTINIGILSVTSLLGFVGREVTTIIRSDP